MATGKQVRRHHEPEGVVCVAFVPDGKTLAYVSHFCTIHLVEAASGREVARSPYQ